MGVVPSAVATLPQPLPGREGSFFGCSKHLRIPLLALVTVIGLTAATAVAEDYEHAAAVELKIIQVNPEKPAGAEMLAAWEKVVGELDKSDSGSDKAAPSKASGDGSGGMCQVIACGSAQFFGAALKTNAFSESADDDAFKVLVAPRIVLHYDQKASISVGRDVPYMVKRKDGSLVVEHSGDLFEGVAADVKVSEPSADATFLTELQLKISRVTGRQAIEGVPFEVGRPTMSVQEIQSTLRLAERQDVVMRLPQSEADQPIFAIVRVCGLEK